MSIQTQSYVAVVDDDESLCRSVGRLLRASGLQAVTYPSAEAFLADSKRPAFDCLVLDITLTGMSGIELRERLAAVASKTPVVYLTANDNATIREHALRTGCAAYFRKTEPSDKVLAAIRGALTSDTLPPKLTPAEQFATSRAAKDFVPRQCDESAE